MSAFIFMCVMNKHWTHLQSRRACCNGGVALSHTESKMRSFGKNICWLFYLYQQCTALLQQGMYIVPKSILHFLSINTIPSKNIQVPAPRDCSLLQDDKDEIQYFQVQSCPMAEQHVKYHDSMQTELLII